MSRLLDSLTDAHKERSERPDGAVPIEDEGLVEETSEPKYFWFNLIALILLAVLIVGGLLLF